MTAPPVDEQASPSRAVDGLGHPEGDRPCPACGDTQVEPRLVKWGARYVACATCGLAHLEPRPSAAALLRHFASGYFDGVQPDGYVDYLADAPLHRRNAERRLGFMARHGVRGPAALLDVGCAHGFLLEAARSRGWAARGVEPTEEAASAARAQGFTVDRDLVTVADAAPGSFDVVTLYQVLEHVTDPVAMLRDVRRCLRPDGVLVVETWDAGSRIARMLGPRWQVPAPPSVVWLWDRAAFTRLLAAAGFAVTRWDATPKEIRVGFAGALLTRQPGRLAPRLGHVLEHPALADRSVPYRLGDLVTATARPAIDLTRE